VAFWNWTQHLLPTTSTTTLEYDRLQLEISIVLPPDPLNTIRAWGDVEALALWSTQPRIVRVPLQVITAEGLDAWFDIVVFLIVTIAPDPIDIAGFTAPVRLLDMILHSVM